ncbi:MAG: hypothetical protein QGG53_25450 [Planctomycetota bacterium]|nr:hypothetical protein [Planctomycetota bacterium]
MAKPFLNRLGEHWRIGVILILIVFVILFFLGYYLDDTKTWRLPRGEDPRMKLPPGEPTDR